MGGLFNKQSVWAVSFGIHTHTSHFCHGRLWSPSTLSVSSFCIHQTQQAMFFLDLFCLQVFSPQWKQSLILVLFQFCVSSVISSWCSLPQTLLSHSPSHIFSPPPCVALADALMDTDTTPRIQLINRSNFATDAIFLSFPPAGWAPLIQLADPPRFQTLLCSPLSLTNHLPPCLCDRAEPWRSLCGTCWRCLRVASPLEAVTAGASAWPADSSCSSSKPSTRWWVCPRARLCACFVRVGASDGEFPSAAVQAGCAQRRVRCVIFGDFERNQPIKWLHYTHYTNIHTPLLYVVECILLLECLFFKFCQGGGRTHSHFCWFCCWYMGHLFPFKLNIFMLCIVFCDFLTCCCSLSDKDKKIDTAWRRKVELHLSWLQVSSGITRLSFRLTLVSICVSRVRLKSSYTPTSSFLIWPVSYSGPHTVTCIPRPPSFLLVYLRVQAFTQNTKLQLLGLSIFHIMCLNGGGLFLHQLS